MDRKIIQFVVRFLQLVSINILLCCCTAKREIIPYQQSQDKQKVNVGLSVNKSANFSFSISTSDPIILRTFVMQGFDLSFSGEYAYMVRVPSAKDVEKFISHHPGEVKATMQGNQEKRPDIRPVLEALNKTDVFIYLKGKKAGKVKKFNVNIDPSTGTLLYSITLPNIYSMDLPISVNLTSRKLVNNDEFTSGQFPDRNTSDRPQPFGVGQSSRSNDNQKELSITYHFGKPSAQQQRKSQPTEFRF